MCSATSAIDQRSGPALNVHCASDRSAIESRNACRVCCRCFSNESRSCCVSGWAYAGTNARENASTVRAITRFVVDIGVTFWFDMGPVRQPSLKCRHDNVRNRLNRSALASLKDQRPFAVSTGPAEWAVAESHEICRPTMPATDECWSFHARIAHASTDPPALAAIMNSRTHDHAPAKGNAYRATNSQPEAIVLINAAWS